MVDWSAAETGKGDRGVVWVVEEILLRGKDVVEGESWVVGYLLIVRERRGRVAGPDGGGLTMEFYKSTTALARDTFGWGRVGHWLVAMGAEETYSRGWSRRRGDL